MQTRKLHPPPNRCIFVLNYLESDFMFKSVMLLGKAYFSECKSFILTNDLMMVKVISMMFAKIPN